RARTATRSSARCASGRPRRAARCRRRRSPRTRARRTGCTACARASIATCPSPCSPTSWPRSWPASPGGGPERDEGSVARAAGLVQGTRARVGEQARDLLHVAAGLLEGRDAAVAGHVAWAGIEAGQRELDVAVVPVEELASV